MVKRMKERYFVATLSKNGPDFEGVYWFGKKGEAMSEAMRQRSFYTEETIVLAKVLNIKHSTIVGKVVAKE